MKVIKPNIVAAVNVLKKGRIIIYPTETSYGIGADATNPEAIRRINMIKGRKEKFMPIIISDMKMAQKYLILNSNIKKLMKKFMPGPLTLVVKKKMKTKKMLGGFRIPANRFALTLVKRLGKPITATSANISGNKPIYNIAQVKKTFSNKVDLIINAGTLPKRQPSTVYDVYTKKIIRQGKINKKDIEKIIKK